jgi:hypothetical protein
MTTKAFLNPARWLGFAPATPSKTRHPVMRRRLSVEPLEERRVLSAGSFAAALYQDVLGRAGDPTDYQTFFDRAADPGGRQAWINNMENGETEEQVMSDFLNSSEFQQLNPTPTQFVTALYQDVLGRAPDPAGLSGFVTALTNGTSTPADVVQTFINSPERNVNLVNSYYATFLQRAPDADGQAFWVQQLDDGLATDGSAAESFMVSQEFIAANPLPPLIAAPGQVVITVLGNGSVTDSTGQLNTAAGQNVAVYGPNDTPTLMASSPNVSWSDGNLSGQNPVLSPSDFANGLNLTVLFF